MKEKKSLNNSSRQQSFLHGSAILVIAMALVKVIGAIYKIPLGELLDTAGMGYYSTAYDLYIPMYSIAMAGLPIAISRIVAEHMAKGRYNDVKKTLKIAQLAFIVTGGTGFFLMVLLAFLLTGRPFDVFHYGAFPGIIAIAPCLLFCCVMSAYRGYYEGLRNMTPTAVSQVLEALGKLIFGFGIAFVILKITNNYSYAAAGAMFGITLGTILSTGYLIVKYTKEKDVYFTAEQLVSSPDAKSGKETLKSLVLIAIPIVLGSLVNNVTSLIDVAMVQKQLANAISDSPEYFKSHYASLIASEISKNPEFSWGKDLPNSLYGCHRGFAFSIYNLVPQITSVLGVSAIPVLATAWTNKNNAEIKSGINTMIRTTALIAIPAGCGIFALSEGILDLLYSNPEVIKIAGPNLRILGLCAVFAGLNAPMVNMLQAIGKQTVPLRNIAVGAVLKIVINFILVGTPSINILGVPIGTTACYAYIFISNFICFVKYSKVVPDIYSTIIKPLIAGVVCAVSAFITSFALGKFDVSSSICTVSGILVAVIIYIVALSLLRAFEYEDIVSLPKGEKIAKILAKLKLMR